MERTRAKYYARRSNQNDAASISMQRQEEECRAWIAESHLVCDASDRYVEPEGMRSGASVESRPEFQRLLRDVVDTPDVLGNEMGSGIYSHLMSTLKFFNFLDENGVPQDSLFQLAKSNESDRKRRIRELLSEFYPFLLKPSDSFDLSRASLKDLRARFYEHDKKSEAVASKSASFFMAAAIFAGIPLPKMRLNGFKPTGVDGNQRHARDNVSDVKSAPSKKDNARESNKSAKAYGEAMRDLVRIFANAKNLSKNEREELAETALELANLLAGK